jgi:DNA primase catalytic subunit
MGKYKPALDDSFQRRFVYQPPKGDQVDRYEHLRDAAADLATFYMENCPASRELSLAITKLEESVMWANASIARNE